MEEFEEVGFSLKPIETPDENLRQEGKLSEKEAFAMIDTGNTGLITKQVCK